MENIPCRIKLVLCLTNVISQENIYYFSIIKLDMFVQNWGLCKEIKNFMYVCKYIDFFMFVLFSPLVSPRVQ